MTKINTRDWTMGNYPMPKRPRMDVLGALAKLELFNHREAAGVLREALIRSGVLGCSCAKMQRQRGSEHRCALHPERRVKDAYERMDFEKAWDAKVEASS